MKHQLKSGIMASTPFLPLMKRSNAYWNDIEEFLERAEKGELEDDDELIRFEKFFTVDPRCPDWKPYRHGMPKINDIIIWMHGIPSPEQFPQLRVNILQAYIMFRLYYQLYHDFGYLRCNLADALFNPTDLDNRLSFLQEAQIGVMREEVIWPLFGSTQEFFVAMQDYYHQVKDLTYEWPEEEPDLSLLEIQAELRQAGDEVGFKFAACLLMIYGDEENYCQKTLDAISVSMHL